MDETSAPNPAPATADNSADAIAALQKQVHNLVIVLILVVGVLDIYMLRQWVITRKDLKSIEPQFHQMKADFDRVTPTMNNFLKQLTDYARTHPDLQAVLVKYPMFQSSQNVATAAQPVKAAAPAPAKPAGTAPKK